MIDRTSGKGTWGKAATVAVVAALLGMGCDGGDADEDVAVDERGVPLDGPWNEGVPIPEAEQKPGDPEAGLYALGNEAYVTCGIPYALFQFAGGVVPNRDKSPLPGREGAAAALPYSFNLVTTESGATLATQNCLTCHAEKFNGELIVGLGNVTSDYTRSMAGIANLSIPDGILPENQKAELLKFQQRAVAVAPHIRMPTVGSNPADLIAIVLAAHRDPKTLAWQDEPAIDLTDLPPIPMDPPAWWRMGKKHAMFATGLGRGDHRRHMLASSTLCTDNVEEAEAIDAYANDINAYIQSIEAPKYPFEIDLDQAIEGEQLFLANCAGCHGTYGRTETYPNLAIPLEVIGTDAAVATASDGTQQYLIDWYNSSFYGEEGKLVAFKGYVAPPLDGIWATAPFLHNGSVPNLSLVMNSQARPTYWRRVDSDSTNFDQDQLGWPFETRDYGKEGADGVEALYLYDTTLPGHSNSGHVFGDHLSDAERRAVVEYLKTL
ncbi:MAG: c-type cytochrome [Myxococcales bacterium]|nr:c-type cytochrome [Myxococcales bacterium]